MLARRAARLLSGLLLGVAVVFAAGAASADPLIAGCCDSLTTPNWSPPGYLPLIQGVYGPGEVSDQAEGGRPSQGSLADLQEYLAGEDPESVVVLSGTVDSFFDPDGYMNREYSEAVTVANITAMVQASLDDSPFGDAILVAPPPVLWDCSFNYDVPTCEEIDGRLADLSVALAGVAAAGFWSDEQPVEVPFIDLYTIFEDQMPYVDLYGEGSGGDGIHLAAEGDLVIAQAVLDELAPIVGAPCEDGIDNDGDTLIDTADGDCYQFVGDEWVYYASKSEGAALLECDDGVDNDGDGTIDYLGDAGCGAPVQMTESPKCNDGDDNDGDGLVDFDGGQWVWGACTGVACVAPDTWPDCGCPPGVSDPDEDGVADPDPHCSSPSIDREQPGGMHCGLGFEVGLLMAPLMWWHRRRAARR